ncbi:MAG: hypothetical protein V4616_10025 [Bacteroidota bacterium]
MLVRLRHILPVFILACFLPGCEPEIKQKLSGQPFFEGETNLDRFVVVGGEYLSGFTDRDLFLSGQKSSIGSILSDRFRKVGGGNFRQALMFDERGLGHRLKLERVADCEGNEDVQIQPYGGTPDPRNHQRIGSNGPFSDYAVPYARAIDLNNTSYSGLNTYFDRMSSRNSSSIMDDVQLADPTFFVMWAGDRDVLGYALNGGAAGLGVPSISGATSFRNAMQTALQKLTARGAKGVMVNIPSLESLPFFTTIPYDAIVVTQEEAERLNLLYLTSPNVRFKEGKNPFVIREGLTTRFMTPNEYVCLTVDPDSVKCGGLGSSTPLSDQYVLTEAEISESRAAISQFNGIIAELAASYQLPLFDANAYFSKVNRIGINIDGIDYNTNFITGGFISLDGSHLTPRGNAIIANEIIKLINDRFRAKIPLTDINSYPTVQIP